MIDQKTLDKLNYNLILEKLKFYASSSLTKESIDKIRPLIEKEPIEQLLSETSQALHLIDHHGMPSLYGIRSFEQELHHVSIGGIIEMGDLLDLSDILRSVHEFLNYFDISEDKEEQEEIKKYADRLTDLSNIERKLSAIILSDTEISDDASPNLNRIRRSLVRTSQSIRDKLQSILKSESKSGKLQDEIITIREGRYVVPVKAENKSTFKGIIHDQSTSGATVYIEPMVIVELNNDLRMLEREEKEEIHKILKELSLQAFEYEKEINENVRVLLQLDLIFCRAKLAIDMEASKPILLESGEIDLKKARHPEIPREDVVPIDLKIDKDIDTLVITGPNTGGKTVTLKTAALMNLLAQSGLFIPCEPESKITIYKNIYADIGDEQSIEQSLSTFSAHMTNIVRIFNNITEDSLVLLDELGAGTDPIEGAALAISILEKLREYNITTMATTHYSQLKYYALKTEGVINGAVEFDVKTLRPTYKLEIGLPGKSNAFEISRRLGLEDTIISQAKSFIDDENESFEDVLINIEKNKKELEAMKIEQEKSLREIQSLKEKLKIEAEKQSRKEEKILQEAKDEAYLILEEAKEQSQSLIKELRYQQGGIIDHQKLNEVEGRLNKSMSGLKKKKELLKENKSKKALTIHLGDDVEILGLGQIGEVLSLPDRKGDFQVQVGILKMNVNKKNVKLIREKEEDISQVQVREVIKARKSQNVKNEIDLRGTNVEEAIVEIDKYLDDAYLFGHKEVRLIHGKGTGALRKGVQNYLPRQKHVKSFRDGSFSEGGLGVTVVELK